MRWIIRLCVILSHLLFVSTDDVDHSGGFHFIPPPRGIELESTPSEQMQTKEKSSRRKQPDEGLDFLPPPPNQDFDNDEASNIKWSNDFNWDLGHKPNHGVHHQTFTTKKDANSLVNTDTTIPEHLHEAAMFTPGNNAKDFSGNERRRISDLSYPDQVRLHHHYVPEHDDSHSTTPFKFNENERQSSERHTAPTALDTGNVGKHAHHIHHDNDETASKHKSGKHFHQPYSTTNAQDMLTPVVTLNNGRIRNTNNHRHHSHMNSEKAATFNSNILNSDGTEQSTQMHLSELTSQIDEDTTSTKPHSSNSVLTSSEKSKGEKPAVCHFVLWPVYVLTLHLFTSTIFT